MSTFIGHTYQPHLAYRRIWLIKYAHTLNNSALSPGPLSFTFQRATLKAGNGRGNEAI